MNTTTKTRTQKNNTQAKEIAGLKAEIGEIKALLQALANAPANDAPAPAPAKNAPAKGKGKKADKAKQAKREAHHARVGSITAKKAEWATHTLAHAIKLAAAEVRANRKANVANEAIRGCSPESARVWLTSATNQALKSVREREGVHASEVEAMLAKASK